MRENNSSNVGTDFRRQNLTTIDVRSPQWKKWNESDFRPPLCTYRLNWARRTSWGWWDDWDDTVLKTQDSKFEPWRSEAEHATSRSRRLPTILTFTRGWGRNIFVSFKPPNRTPSSGVKGSGANHYPRAPAPPRNDIANDLQWLWTHNIGIQINRNELNKTFMVILCRVKPFTLHGLCKNNSALWGFSEWRSGPYSNYNYSTYDEERLPF